MNFYNFSEKDRKLHDRIKEDVKPPGELITNKRSIMIQNILGLLNDGLITLDDLNGFSDNLREHMEFNVKHFPEDYQIQKESEE